MDFNAFNAGIIEEFRANGGRVGGQFAGSPLLLLTTTGAKSGKLRVNPLGWFPDGEDRFVIASKAGMPTNPDWYYNLVANPDVHVEVGTESYDATAVVADDAERDRLFAAAVAAAPAFGEYQAGTSRRIPVVVLKRKP